MITIVGEVGTTDWVSLWRGVLLCDVLAAQPQALPPRRAIPLPLAEMGYTNGGERWIGVGQPFDSPLQFSWRTSMPSRTRPINAKSIFNLASCNVQHQRYIVVTLFFSINLNKLFENFSRYKLSQCAIIGDSSSFSKWRMVFLQRCRYSHLVDDLAQIGP